LDPLAVRSPRRGLRTANAGDFPPVELNDDYRRWAIVLPPRPDGDIGLIPGVVVRFTSDLTLTLAIPADAVPWLPASLVAEDGPGPGQPVAYGPYVAVALRPHGATSRSPGSASRSVLDGASAITAASETPGGV
jgi:hypothetical protein